MGESVIPQRRFFDFRPHDVRGNIPAWRLYNSLGFKRVLINEWARKWM
jgi:hypothetical protein